MREKERKRERGRLKKKRRGGGGARVIHTKSTDTIFLIQLANTIQIFL